MDVNAPFPSTADMHTLSAEALDQMAEPHSQSVQWPLTHATPRDRSDRASSPGGLGLPRRYPYKAHPAGKDLKSAGSLPILQSALHRRFAFAQGMGILPPSLGVTPTHEGPFPPQALILKDNSHRREAYAKGQGALPPPSSSRQMQPTLPRVNSSDSDSLHESASSTFVTMPEAPDLMTGLNDALGGSKGGQGRLAPSGRAMKQVDSFNTDVVRQCIDKAQKAEASDKHISSAGELTLPCLSKTQMYSKVLTLVSEHTACLCPNRATLCMGVPLMQWQCGFGRCQRAWPCIFVYITCMGCHFHVYYTCSLSLLQCYSLDFLVLIAAPSACGRRLHLLRLSAAQINSCMNRQHVLCVLTACIFFLFLQTVLSYVVNKLHLLLVFSTCNFFSAATRCLFFSFQQPASSSCANSLHHHPVSSVCIFSLCHQPVVSSCVVHLLLPWTNCFFFLWQQPASSWCVRRLALGAALAEHPPQDPGHCQALPGCAALPGEGGGLAAGPPQSHARLRGAQRLCPTGTGELVPKACPDSNHSTNDQDTHKTVPRPYSSDGLQNVPHLPLNRKRVSRCGGLAVREADEWMQTCWSLF